MFVIWQNKFVANFFCSVFFNVPDVFLVNFGLVFTVNGIVHFGYIVEFISRYSVSKLKFSRWAGHSQFVWIYIFFVVVYVYRCESFTHLTSVSKPNVWLFCECIGSSLMLSPSLSLSLSLWSLLPPLLVAYISCISLYYIIAVVVFFSRLNFKLENFRLSVLVSHV